MAEASRDQPLSNAELRAWQGMLSAHTILLKELDQRLRAEHALAVSEFDVLITLFNAGDQRMTDLAAAIMLTPAGLTHMVTRLERDRLVQRTIDPADRRSYLVSLTAAGRSRLDAARSTHNDVIRTRFTHRLSRQQLRQLADIWGSVLGR